MARMQDDTWHEAEIMERRQRTPTYPWEYYIHFTELNRRLDRWVHSDAVLPRDAPLEQSQLHPHHLALGMIPASPLASPLHGAGGMLSPAFGAFSQLNHVGLPPLPTTPAPPLRERRKSQSQSFSGQSPRIGDAGFGVPPIPSLTLQSFLGSVPPSPSGSTSFAPMSPLSSPLHLAT